MLDRARQLAAELLEASPDDIVVTDDGRVGVAGVPARALTWAELAAAGRPATTASRWPRRSTSRRPGPTFPFGAHVAVVEVDTETGAVRPLRHVAVDDCGRILNPLLVTGQQHGGIAQGMAQALWEQFVYDDDGNPLTSNLADYAMPSAAELPDLRGVQHRDADARSTRSGAKGIGESGTIGSTPAVQNAVVDAVSHLGRPPHRHALHPRAGVAGDHRVGGCGRRAARVVGVAGAAGVLRRPPHPRRHVAARSRGRGHLSPPPAATTIRPQHGRGSAPGEAR